ncbi:uncharacterized protein [Mycetomoellerius zeteki]|uniref:uncharacterized protein n=1 Tax=Mycetomoellerius zeteki TaxID=64791 RepID=UPI00084E4B53|nr:PREDICTED: uncharacterized protein LOC108726846 [Trachymyrmex zeteki]
MGEWNHLLFLHRAWGSSTPDFIKLRRLQYKVIKKAMGYRISTPIDTMLAEAKEFELNIRFNLTASKFIYKCMANKFNIVYNSLEEMEITAVRRNCKVKAIKESRLFKFYVISRHEKSITFRSTYSPAYWYSYEVFSTTIKFLS